MVIPILLLAILFIAGFFTIFFDFPTKKHLKSLFSTKNTPSTASSSTINLQPQVSLSPQNNHHKRSGYKKAELKRVFAMFDKNGDGFIAKQELKESFKNLRLVVTEKEVEEMVVKVDVNEDGLIDFDEFCILYEAMIIGQVDKKGVTVAEEEEEEGEEEGDLKDAFEVFDKDKDGLISVEELGLVLSSLGLKEGKKVEDCKEMIKKVDVDGDGMVNFDEFKQMMKKGAF